LDINRNKNRKTVNNKIRGSNEHLFRKFHKSTKTRD
jgi:hypothetical protein